jgi:hypothetical protein
MSKSGGRGGRLSSRAFLKTSASTAALLSAASAQFPFGAYVTKRPGPE